MTSLFAKLDERVQILKPKDDPNSITGGFDREYEHLLTVWMSFKPSGAGVSKNAGGMYVRGVQVDERVTHVFESRREAVEELGSSFYLGFSNAFDSISDRNPMKSDYFFFVMHGDAVAASFDNGFGSGFNDRTLSQGRLFKIHNIMDNKEQGEYMIYTAEEIEEQNTGYAV
jgi:hypothetical protein